ncbi:MAG: ATP synthase F1 subunit delta [Bacteroidales bacterium]|nr:ATP synthase F1 subunit delta [Bacteroidales bacterium]
MNISKVGKRYAKALFSFALEQDNTEEVMKDIDLVNNTIKQSRELQLLLKNPLMNSKRKKMVIRALFEKYVGDTVLTYLMIILQKNRETFIPEIAEQFVVYLKQYKNIKTAYLSTAQSVNDNVRKIVIESLQEQIKAEIELVENINEDLIGGLVLRVDDNEIDMSIKKRINELEKEFKVNVYEGKF